MSPVSVVVATRDRTADVLGGSGRQVRDRWRESSGGSPGAAGRNLGVTAAARPYVACCDDDTW